MCQYIDRRNMPVSKKEVSACPIDAVPGAPALDSDLYRRAIAMVGGT